MQAFLTVVALITLASGVYFNKIGTNQFRQISVEEPQVLSIEDNIIFATPTDTPTPLPLPSVLPSPHETVLPTTISNQVNVSEYRYPNSLVVAQGDSLSLSTTDNANTVADWYKQLLKEKKFGARSISQTNTNGNFLAVMSASQNSLNIVIEISQPSSSPQTLITIKETNN